MEQYIQRIIDYQDEISTALYETAFMIGISVFAAITVGLPVGTFIYLTRKNGVLESKFVSGVLNGYVNIVRSFPFLLFVVFLIPFTRMVLGTSFGTYAASLPLSFVAVAIYARFVEQSLLEVPRGIIDTAYSLGATIPQLIFHFLYVEARSSLVIGLTSATISLISYSTVMGVVGGGGIGDFAMRYGYQRYEHDLMYTTIIIMILMVQGIQLLGSITARKLDKR